MTTSRTKNSDRAFNAQHMALGFLCVLVDSRLAEYGSNA